jgi:hypothetical protein
MQVHDTENHQRVALDPIERTVREATQDYPTHSTVKLLILERIRYDSAQCSIQLRDELAAQLRSLQFILTRR